MAKPIEEWTAEERLGLSLGIDRDLRKLGLGSEIDEANIISQNVLHNELGYFPKSTLKTYNLSEETRDRLIAHTRQDAATSLVHAIKLRGQLNSIEKIMRNCLRALIAIGVGVLLILGRALF